jgi:transcriptional regulator with XRE-family HTH domain
LDPEQAAERAKRRAVFGGRLRELRQAAGLTQEQLALAAGIDRPFLVQIEGGKRSLLVERLDDIAKALGISILELFPEERW